MYDLPIPQVRVGQPANLTMIDLGARFEVGAGGYASRSANCCFQGRTLHGRVELTLAAGQIAFRRAAIAQGEPVGGR
jgi:dihydroorotase